ncbi:hypothetical protein J6590_025532 [Homalodisca vitripennis]|nr:hypothetical protein J6590_025532 [Homalodisca vitripennis]
MLLLSTAHQMTLFIKSRIKEIVLGSMKKRLSAFPNLDSVNTAEHLGVVLDSRLSWTDHVDKLYGRLSSTLFTIRRVKHVSTEDAVRTAYKTHGDKLSGRLSSALFAIRRVKHVGTEDAVRTAYNSVQVLS